MKEILLVGDIENENSNINDLFKNGDYNVRKVNNATKAIKLLKQNSPDFVLCTGRIQQTSDGRYFLEL